MDPGVQSALFTMEEVVTMRAGRKADFDFVVLASTRAVTEHKPYKASLIEGGPKLPVAGRPELPVICFGEVAETIIRTDAKTLYELVGGPDSEKASSEEGESESTDDDGVESNNEQHADQIEKELKRIKANACERQFAFKIGAKWQHKLKSHEFYVNDVQLLH